MTKAADNVAFTELLEYLDTIPTVPVRDGQGSVEFIRNLRQSGDRQTIEQNALKNREESSR